MANLPEIGENLMAFNGSGRSGSRWLLQSSEPILPFFSYQSGE
ncbi:MAG: hypothetical protein ACJAS0_000570 [Alcanivorax borkumensis]|jgi:hypothetical protein